MQILARVAELADALGSGPSEGNFIGVQVPFRAKKRDVLGHLFFYQPTKIYAAYQYFLQLTL